MIIKNELNKKSKTTGHKWENIEWAFGDSTESHIQRIREETNTFEKYESKVRGYIVFNNFLGSVRSSEFIVMDQYHRQSLVEAFALSYHIVNFCIESGSIDSANPQEQVFFLVSIGLYLLILDNIVRKYNEQGVIDKGHSIFLFNTYLTFDSDKHLDKIQDLIIEGRDVMSADAKQRWGSFVDDLVESRVSIENKNSSTIPPTRKLLHHIYGNLFRIESFN